MTTLAGPAHLLQFVISLVSTEPTHTCLAVLLCWPGGCWLSPGCGRDHLGWDKDQWPCLAHLSGENATKHSWEGMRSVLSRHRGHWAALSTLGGCPIKASLWKPTGKGLERSGVFSIRNYLSTRPWAKPAVAPSCQWEFCTSALKAAQTSCTYSVTAARSHCLLERLLCVPSPTCHDRNKPVRSSLWTTFFYF